MRHKFNQHKHLIRGRHNDIHALYHEIPLVRKAWIIGFGPECAEIL
jgi:hypothetical protein